MYKKVGLKTAVLCVVLLGLQACGSVEPQMANWWYDQRWESASKSE